MAICNWGDPRLANNPNNSEHNSNERENQKSTSLLSTPIAIAKAVAACIPITNGPRRARPGTPNLSMILCERLFLPDSGLSVLSVSGSDRSGPPHSGSSLSGSDLPASCPSCTGPTCSALTGSPGSDEDETETGSAPSGLAPSGSDEDETLPESDLFVQRFTQCLTFSPAYMTGSNDTKFPAKPTRAAGIQGSPAITPKGTATHTSNIGIAAPINTPA